MKKISMKKGSNDEINLESKNEKKNLRFKKENYNNK
jgi:hypothetical protein